MIDAFLVFFLVTLLPIAFVGIGGRTEHALFATWRWLQVAALLAAACFVLYRLIRRDWRALVVLVLVGAGVAYLDLSYIGIAWDAQIEYFRVLQLAKQYGSLTEGYRHGITHWIFGYPPGASLSVAFFQTLNMVSPNIAQGILILLWSGSLMARHMRDVDLAGKLAFFVLLATGSQLVWHYTYFYNNLFYALVWATLVLVPMFGSSLRAWEWCGYALVLVWLRPQWQIAAIPIGTGALSTLLAASGWSRRHARDTAIVAAAALTVAWLGSAYWQTASVELDRAMSRETTAVIAKLTEQQRSPVLEIEVRTKPFAQQYKPVPPLLSHASVAAVGWAYHVTARLYAVSLAVLALIGFVAVWALRRRGLVFLTPVLSPLAVLLGTAVFARYADLKTNTWALERLQIISPILMAGTLTALHRALRARTDE